MPATPAQQPAPEKEKPPKELTDKKQEAPINTAKKEPADLSYIQLLKQQCQYMPQQRDMSQHKPVPQHKDATNLPIEKLKELLMNTTSEILRKVLSRSDSLNTLRQIIDIKAKIIKVKKYESSTFQVLLDKEVARVG